MTDYIVSKTNGIYTEKYNVIKDFLNAYLFYLGKFKLYEYKRTDNFKLIEKDSNFGEEYIFDNTTYNRYTTEYEVRFYDINYTYMLPCDIRVNYSLEEKTIKNYVFIIKFKFEKSDKQQNLYKLSKLNNKFFINDSVYKEKHNHFIFKEDENYDYIIVAFKQAQIKNKYRLKERIIKRFDNTLSVLNFLY